MAKTSHNSGELKFTHRSRVLGYGNMKNARGSLPIWMSGNNPAHITAKIVIASAARLILVLHFCLKSSRMAEMKVPAWPIPTHHTKLVILHPHPIVRFTPQVPIPYQMV